MPSDLEFTSLHLVDVMRRSFFGLLVVGTLLSVIGAIAAAADSKDEAIKKDRDRIEGTWRIVALEVDGNKATDEDAKKLSVVNGSDGTWSLLSEGNEISKGTSTFDPTKTPKTIDFTPTEGAGLGNQYLGIYELGDNNRRLCFAPPGKTRPTEFSSLPGSEHILVTFERDKDAAIKIDRKKIEDTWRAIALVFDGNTATDDDTKKITVVNGSDGTWSLLSEGIEISKGTSTFDPTKTPKTIDFTITEGDGKGNQHLGIYELGENSRKLCFASPGKERPTEFSSLPGSDRILVTFERVKTK